ncbi:hypothetical protein SMD27_09450 [Dongia soli]|uniref:Uncharacterized protein n=1 Tax=Dongia soli TaxID=600628 RepID=A0ABU5EAI7_9PROT|nr:hypothetical protein [Dongia soli]
MLIVALVVLGLVAIYLWSMQRQAPIVSARYKEVFVENCLKQANDAAQQQNKPFNEEQKQMLQQVCNCGAARSSSVLSTTDVNTFLANPSDPAMLDKIKPILEACAKESRGSGTAP